MKRLILFFASLVLLAQSAYAGGFQIMEMATRAASMGNAFTAGVNYFIQIEDGTSKLSGANYYWFFAAAMFITAVIFIGVAMRYKPKTYIHEEMPAEIDH